MGRLFMNKYLYYGHYESGNSFYFFYFVSLFINQVHCIVIMFVIMLCRSPHRSHPQNKIINFPKQ